MGNLNSENRESASNLPQTPVGSYEQLQMPPDSMARNMATPTPEAELNTELKIAVEPFTDVSLARVTELFVDCFTKPPWDEKWTVATAKEAITELRDRGADLALARAEEEIVGFSIGLRLKDYPRAGDLVQLADSKTSYYFAEFGIDAPYRGMGLGLKLFQELDRLAERSQMETIVTRTRVDNTAAIRVFEKCGLECASTNKITSGGVESERVNYRKQFKQSM